MYFQLLTQPTKLLFVDTTPEALDACLESEEIQHVLNTHLLNLKPTIVKYLTDEWRRGSGIEVHLSITFNEKGVATYIKFSIVSNSIEVLGYHFNPRTLTS